MLMSASPHCSASSASAPGRSGRVVRTRHSMSGRVRRRGCAAGVGRVSAVGQTSRVLARIVSPGPAAPAAEPREHVELVGAVAGERGLQAAARHHDRAPWPSPASTSPSAPGTVDEVRRGRLLVVDVVDPADRPAVLAEHRDPVPRRVERPRLEGEEGGLGQPGEPDRPDRLPLRDAVACPTAGRSPQGRRQRLSVTEAWLGCFGLAVAAPDPPTEPDRGSPRRRSARGREQGRYGASRAIYDGRFGRLDMPRTGQ